MHPVTNFGLSLYDMVNMAEVLAFSALALLSCVWAYTGNAWRWPAKVVVLVASWVAVGNAVMLWVTLTGRTHNPLLMDLLQLVKDVPGSIGVPFFIGVAAAQLPNFGMHGGRFARVTLDYAYEVFAVSFAAAGVVLLYSSPTPSALDTSVEPQAYLYRAFIALPVIFYCVLAAWFHFDAYRAHAVHPALRRRYLSFAVAASCLVVWGFMHFAWPLPPGNANATAQVLAYAVLAAAILTGMLPPRQGQDPVDIGIESFEGFHEAADPILAELTGYPARPEPPVSDWETLKHLLDETAGLLGPGLISPRDSQAATATLRALADPGTRLAAPASFVEAIPDHSPLKKDLLAEVESYEIAHRAIDFLRTCPPDLLRTKPPWLQLVALVANDAGFLPALFGTAPSTTPHELPVCPNLVFTYQGVRYRAYERPA